MFVCCECRVLSGRGLCDELITLPEESYRLCCVVVCDLETSRMGAPYIYGISHLRVKRRDKPLFDVTERVVNHVKRDFYPKSSSVLRTKDEIPVTEGITNFVAKVILTFATRFETC